MLETDFSSIIYSVVKLALVYLVYKYILFSIPYIRLIYHYRKFPSESGHWLLGDLIKFAPEFPKVNREVIADAVREYVFRNWLKNDHRNDVSITWVGWLPLVICSSHRSLEPIITAPEITKHPVYRLTGLKDGLVCSRGSKWKGHRRMLEPLFTSKQLSLFTPIIDYAVEDMINKLDSKLSEPVALAPYIHSLTMDVILEVVFKLPTDFGKNGKERFIEIIEEYEEALSSRFCNPLYWNDWLFEKFPLGKKLSKMSDEGDEYLNYLLDCRFKTKFLSDSRRKEMCESENLNENDTNIFGDRPHIDMVDFMTKSKQDGKVEIDRDGMIEEVRTMILAGHETVANSLSWLMFNLGNHQEIQDRIAQEINDVITSDEDITDLGKLNKLVYMEQCIKESMRLVPPLPIVLRHLENDVKIGSKVLPKDSAVVLFILAAHHDPTVYPDPFRFNPDRFDPSVVDSIPKYAFLPFGLGPRMCIGYRYAMIEMKIFLTRFLRRYSVKSIKKMEEVKYYIELISKPTVPLEVIISLRD